MSLSIDFASIHRTLDSLPHGEKEPVKRMICETYNISKSTLHRELRARFGKKKEIVRPDDPRKVEIALMVIEMKARGMERSIKEHEMATDRCLDRLVRKGIIQEGEISAAHCNRIIRQKLMFREPESRVRIESEYALQEVQLDFSQSKYFRIVKFDEKREDWLIKAAPRAISFVKNESRFKLILAGGIDHFSRMRLVRCYPGAAESTMIGISFLNWMLNRDEDEHMLHHLPERYAVDNGASWVSQEFEHLSSAIGVDLRFIPPGEKESNGMIENYWKPVWKWELEWSEDYPQLYLSDYNELLHFECSKEQLMPHPRKGLTRQQIYQQSILRTRPRKVNVDLMQIATRTWTRRVSQELAVSVEGQEFKVPQYVHNTWTNGKQIRVYRNLQGQWLGELLDAAGKPFELTAFETVTMGTYSGNHKETMARKIKKDILAGYSLYRDVNKTAPKEIIDEETGEVFESPIALKPVSQHATVNSVFTAPVAAPAFDSVFEAKSWIGARLEAWHMNYSDVAHLFDELLTGHAPERGPIEDRLQELVKYINENLQTGT